jgi:hypothetical protein
MTKIKDLIAELQKHNPDGRVLYYDKKGRLRPLPVKFLKEMFYLLEDNSGYVFGVLTEGE